MLKNWKTKELIFLALIAALMFVIAITLGLFLTYSTGIPLLGGLIVNWFLAFGLVLVALIIKKFGVLSLTVLIYTLLSVPTLNMGPPGIYKIIVGVALGLIMDLFLYFGNYKKPIYYIGAGITYMIIPFVMFYAMALLGMPQASKLAPLLLSIAGIGLIQGLLGALLAFIVYNKIKNKKIIKQISN